MTTDMQTEQEFFDDESPLILASEELEHVCVTVVVQITGLDEVVKSVLCSHDILALHSRYFRERLQLHDGEPLEERVQCDAMEAVRLLQQMHNLPWEEPEWNMAWAKLSNSWGMMQLQQCYTRYVADVIAETITLSTDYFDRLTAEPEFVISWWDSICLALCDPHFRSAIGDDDTIVDSIARALVAYPTLWRQDEVKRLSFEIVTKITSALMMLAHDSATTCQGLTEYVDYETPRVSICSITE